MNDIDKMRISEQIMRKKPGRFDIFPPKGESVQQKDII